MSSKQEGANTDRPNVSAPNRRDQRANLVRHMPFLCVHCEEELRLRGGCNRLRVGTRAILHNHTNLQCNGPRLLCCGQRELPGRSTTNCTAQTCLPQCSSVRLLSTKPSGNMMIVKAVNWTGRNKEKGAHCSGQNGCTLTTRHNGSD